MARTFRMLRPSSVPSMIRRARTLSPMFMISTSSSSNSYGLHQDRSVCSHTKTYKSIIKWHFFFISFWCFNKEGIRLTSRRAEYSDTVLHHIYPSFGSTLDTGSIPLPITGIISMLTSAPRGAKEFYYVKTYGTTTDNNNFLPFRSSGYSITWSIIFVIEETFPPSLSMFSLKTLDRWKGAD